jgi:hypothetical protein
MDPFHERLARVALDVTASYGFALAGGYAVQAHGFLDRPSADVDLFAEASAQFDFSQAVDAVDRLPDTLFAPYGLDPRDVSALKARMHAWAEKLSRD